MRRILILLVISFQSVLAQEIKLRPLADTVGFAHTKAQMDSVMNRIMRTQEKKLRNVRIKANVGHETVFKAVIAPHDDYSYVGYMYPLALQNIHAKTVIIFGVAHQAKKLGLENKLVFDSYTHWSGPYGNVKVSSMREEIMALLPKEMYVVNDTMQKIEHSVEAEIPFLQYYNKRTFNRELEIISILVPYMPIDTIQKFARPLADAIASCMKKRKLPWGEGLAFVISADAVHYGDEDWGGKNFAFYGADKAGYNKAVAHEQEIMEKCFKKIENPRIELFTQYTVQETNYKEYKWTWCGRYSVPMGLMTAFNLSMALSANLPEGKVLGYETSLSNKHIPVSDLGGMGVTAPAKLRHWVGYPAIGFK
jgi:MEMO1 family protein